MAGVLNKSKRQYNLKVFTKKGHRAVLRLVPGLNFVDDETWNLFKNDPYVNSLIDEDIILSNKKSNEDVKTKKATVPKSKVEPLTLNGQPIETDNKGKKSSKGKKSDKGESKTSESKDDAVDSEDDF